MEGDTRLGMCIGGPRASQRIVHRGTHYEYAKLDKLPPPTFNAIASASVEVQKGYYYWMPWRADADFYGFWVHQDIKSPSAVMQALIEGYHPNVPSEYPPL